MLLPHKKLWKRLLRMCRSFNCLIKCLLWKWKFHESHEKPSAKLMDTRQQRRGMHAHHDICTFERRNQSTPGHGATTNSILQPRVAARKNNAWQLSSDSCVALIKGDERSVYTLSECAVCVFEQYAVAIRLQTGGRCVCTASLASDGPTNQHDPLRAQNIILIGVYLFYTE